MGADGAICAQMAPSASICAQMGPCAPICAHIGPSAPICAQMGPSAPICAQMSRTRSENHTTRPGSRWRGVYLCHVPVPGHALGQGRIRTEDDDQRGCEKESASHTQHFPFPFHVRHINLLCGLTGNCDATVSVDGSPAHGANQFNSAIMVSAGSIRGGITDALCHTPKDQIATNSCSD